MEKGIKAIQYGCGPIGCRIIRRCLEHSSFNLVGAVDIDPAKVGKDISEIAGLEGSTGIVVVDDFSALASRENPILAFHTTGSALPDVCGQIEQLAAAGVNVVSTCEELSYPYRKYPDISSRLDKSAKNSGVTVMATGINPGFLMDAWPVFMSGVCKTIRSIKVTRIQNAATRRLPFQRKIGAGLSPEAFAAKVEGGQFGHVGLPESIWMISDSLNLGVEEIHGEISPVILNHQVISSEITVPEGKAAGLKQTADGLRDGKPVISMDFQAYLGAPESYDAVQVDGEPGISAKIDGGVHGDVGTVSMLINSAPRVIAAPPGLITMRDIPMVFCGSSSDS